jgi:hypothetical protein
MADDPRVPEQALDVALAERSDGVGVEAGERGAEGLALAKDGQPGKPGLEPLQAEALVDRRLRGDGPPPLLVVVGVVRLVARLPAADDYSATSTRTIPSSTMTG